MLKRFVVLVLLTFVSFYAQADYSYGFKTDYNYTNYYANPGYSSTNLNSSGMGSTMRQMQADHASDVQIETVSTMTSDERTLFFITFGLLILFMAIMLLAPYWRSKR